MGNDQNNTAETDTFTHVLRGVTRTVFWVCAPWISGGIYPVVLVALLVLR